MLLLLLLLLVGGLCVVFRGGTDRGRKGVGQGGSDGQAYVSSAYEAPLFDVPCQRACNPPIYQRDTYIYLYMYICILIYIDTYTSYTHTHTYVCIYIHTHIYIYMESI